MPDTTICSPSEINLWVKGNNLGKVKWFGEGITSSDTLAKITVDIQESQKFYVSNRILHPDNLIKNGDFESGNVGFQSNYWSSCFNGSMPQGSYCINNRTNTYWPSWKNCSDHTETGIGNMFVTDGAIVPNEEIWCQTVDVEQYEDYALSTWVTSILNLNNAILQFTINGDTIGAPFEAKPKECEWNEFFEIWNSGLNTSAEICITNENTASNGNDFAMDDISFNKVCYTEDSVSVTVIDNIEFSINNDTTICPGDKVKLKADTVFNSGFSYEWSTGETTKEINIDDIGNYWLKIFHDSGCFASDSINVNEKETPISLLQGDTTLCLQIKNGLKLYAGEAEWIVWSHNDTLDTNAIFIAKTPGFYKVTLYNGANCFVTDRIKIEDFCATDLFIPNAFTPNGDGFNDTFGAEAIETYYYSLNIYNRFGKVIFSTNELTDRWDGKNAPQGTYVYQLNYKQIERETGVLNDYQKIGTVTLLR